MLTDYARRPLDIIFNFTGFFDSFHSLRMTRDLELNWKSGVEPPQSKGSRQIWTRIHFTASLRSGNLFAITA